jgi:glycosyltransferase involved in cell wall biosynthesis
MKISIIVISKDEEKLAETLTSLTTHVGEEDVVEVHEIELIVVDASQGRLGHVRRAHPSVQWIDYTPPGGVRVSIPHQRNVGIQAARGEIIVFTDAGCVPAEGWLSRLIAPVVSGAERVTCGPSWVGDNVYSPEKGTPVPYYVDEAPTINLAFTRELLDLVGDFDERFEYGSDVDFTWRLVAAGAKIRYIADAVVVHDWGTFRRQLKRSVKYGQARIRLYRKHRDRLRLLLRNDPVPVVYAAYVLGLPLALRYRSYVLALVIPLWRARKRPYPARVVLCHCAEGVGSLREVMQMVRTR